MSASAKYASNVDATPRRPAPLPDGTRYMSDFLTSLHAAATDWATRASAGGWLPEGAVGELGGAVLATPGTLFGGGGERPLVAALFGGTGVGKSTLMNRLARESVARASAERPTSREVTVYVHRAVSVERLAETLPMERVRTTLHANDDWRDVLWLDMPDIDSVEAGNRELVTRWLPYVDALLYVVSPERYRDDEGWRLLLEHGANHAWLFVVNHWDRGDERQVEDFRALLVAAGLEAPLIFRTDSGPEGAEDDFAELERTLAELTDRRLIEHLESRGVLQRLRALRARSEALHARLGDGGALAALPERWEEDWTRESAALEEALGWRIDSLAGALVAREPRPGNDPLRRLGLGPSAKEGAVESAPALPGSVTGGAALLDEDALGRIDGVLERFVQRAADAGTLPLAVARRALAPARATLRERLPRLAEDALRRSLATPGTRWRRAAHRLFGALAALLPLAAMLWIGWRVLDAFRDGATNPAAYLGSDFAINGALLLALAWLLPLFLRWKLRPSRKQAAARGLEAGLERALEEVRLVVDEALTALVAERRALDAAQTALWSATPETADDRLPERVRRMLFDAPPDSAQRIAGVRASTQSSTDATPVS